MSALDGLFSWISPRSATRLCRQTASVPRWRFCAQHHQDERCGGVWGGVRHQPEAASASGCGSTHITARTHMRLVGRPGQAGGAQSVRSAPSGGQKVPADDLTAKLLEMLIRKMYRCDGRCVRRDSF